ncbi:MFS transporter [Achromobacter marplatensis]|uniref:DHA2 family methylenomycin A resistance protein-like MFS transporter n=1 Tax=Achromobacter marplatensis TaxID=470868 RepID=A0ABX9G540_9BURK|nr:MFS transporter [Achromobacter marplatensis]OWT58857.1 MFS transporter [Achromobacter marplatensis]RBP16021.1 DHA2 family methylenomycin A resistance protein-like MFS transporter [Achromobacter marplatensis]CAB3692968.1 Multidrug resistance protein Stp [Achromobacter marplatensis]
MTTACPQAPVPAVDVKPITGWLPLVTLAIGFVMAMLDVTVVNVALPSIALQFTVPLTDLVWIVDGYTLTFAALLLVAGALADRYGAKTIYLSGLGVFTLASLLCGLAPNADSLIAARMLQGVGAALFMPSSLSLLTHAYEDEQVRNRMLAAWSAIVAVAGAAGPLLGGVLIHQFGWRGIFLINLPLGIVGLWLARRRVQAAPRRPRALNPLSHLLGVVALSSLCFVLIQGNAYGWTSSRIAGVAALCAVAVVLLVRRERRHAEPILPRALFKTTQFAAANGVGFLINLASYGQLFLLSLFLQHARGTDALQTGIQLVPMLAVFSIGNMISGRVSARWNVSASLLGGVSLATIMSAAGIYAFSPDMAYWPFALMVALGNLGVGIAVPAMTSVVMQVSGKHHANSAAAALNANRQSGALVGVALMGTILHLLPDWHASLPVAYVVIAASYAVAVALVWRHLRRARNA